MKFLICVVLATVAVLAVPSPTHVQYRAVPVGIHGKYLAQDKLTQYYFGYHESNQVRSETKDAFGIVRRSYTYSNPDGSVVTNNYIADTKGFRSSLAPSNGPLLPLVRKAPAVPISNQHIQSNNPTISIAIADAQVPVAPIHVAPSTPLVKVVKYAGGHVAPVASSPFSPYRYAYSPYPYPSYHYAPYGSAYGSVVLQSLL